MKDHEIRAIVQDLAERELAGSGDPLDVPRFTSDRLTCECVPFGPQMHFWKGGERACQCGQVQLPSLDVPHPKQETK